MTEQDFVARAKLEDVAFCDPYSNEREVFYDAEPVSDEEYEECYGTPAADKEGKAVTPSREGDSMGPKAGGRGVSVGEVKSTRRASSWLYRLLKTLGIYSSS